MLFQNFTVPYAQLNSGLPQNLAIIDKQIAKESGYVNINYEKYFPTSIKVPNDSGDTVHIGIFNDLEQTERATNPALTDLFPIADGVTETFENMRGDEITVIVVSGVAGSSHDTDLQISIIQD